MRFVPVAPDARSAMPFAMGNAPSSSGAAHRIRPRANSLVPLVSAIRRDRIIFGPLIPDLLFPVLL